MIKNFRLHIIFRLLFFSATILLLLYSIFETEFYATTAGIALLLLYQIISLIRYIEQTNHKLSRFFDAIEYSDFSQTFTAPGLGKSFDQLNASFTRVLDQFRKARKEKEESFRYLNTIVQHVGTGLITYDPQGNIELLNNAAKKTLGIKSIKNIDTLKKKSKDLVEIMKKLTTGEKALVKVIDNNELLQLSIHVTEFKLQDNLYKLAAITNIHSELEEKEMEAWQNLIRVLTHEIMNSVTPISSLAKTLATILETISCSTNEEEMADVKMGMDTIRKRSEGLIHFVNNYRNLTKIPKPEFETIQLREYFNGLIPLFEEEVESNNVEFSCEVYPENFRLTLDPKLIEQVIINLLINAIHAVTETEKPKIQLIGKVDNWGKPLILVTDNGIGIPDDIKEKIFIPFFTTKNNGSGIGLSFSRQIMRLHGGNIQVQSEPDEGTTFILQF